MKSRYIFAMVGGLAIGLWSPMAMGYNDNTNCYFNTNAPAASRTVTLDGSQSVERSVLIQGTSSSPAMLETTVSTPVLIKRTDASSVVIEDRIVKQKHFLGIGIWPLFDVELL